MRSQVLLSCPTCREWQRKISASQTARDLETTRRMYSQWSDHIQNDHNKPDLELVRQLWPGANVSEGL